MKRGDLIIVALAGDYGKPRPALIVQSDLLAAANSVIVCPLTSTGAPDNLLRVPVTPTPANGLRAPSWVMVEKLSVVSRERCRDVIGTLDAESMTHVEELLAFVLGLSG